MAHRDGRWYFCRSVELDDSWFPVLSTEPGEGQENRGEIIAAFDTEFKPTEEHASLMAAAPALLKAVKLVLALHDHPTEQVPGYIVKLDPMAEKQLREALAAAEGK